MDWKDQISYFSSEIGPSTLFAAYKTIKRMEKQGKARSEICQTLKEKFGEKNPDVKVQVRIDIIQCQRHGGQRLFAGKGRCQSPQ